MKLTQTKIQASIVLMLFAFVIMIILPSVFADRELNPLPNPELSPIPKSDRTVAISDVTIDGKPTKKITFTKIKKDYNIKEESIKKAKKSKDFLNIKKTNYYGDVDIKLMHYVDVTTNQSYGCNCINEISFSPNGTKTTKTICDTCYKDVTTEVFKEIDPETFILRNNEPIYEVMEKATKFEKMNNGWGYAVWTNVNIMGIKVEGATWWNATYGYRYPITTNSSTQYAFSVNDTGGINDDVIWSYIGGTSNYVYSTESGLNGDIAIANETTVKWYENETSRTGNAVTSLWGTNGVNATAIWHLGESSGTLYDSTSEDNDCTSHNSPTYDVDGLFGKSLNLGTTGYLDCTGGPMSGFTDKLTISAWVRDDTAWSSIETFAGNLHYSAGGSDGNGIFYSGTSFMFLIDNNVKKETPEELISPNTGQWYYIVGTYDGANARLYRDGVLKDTHAITGNINLRGGESFLIGKSYHAGNYYFVNGLIDEVRVYNRTLSADEILVNYWNGIANHTRLGAEEESGDSTDPTYSDNSTNSTYAGQHIDHRLKWTDETGLATTGGYIFSFDNGTGTFTNDSWSAFSSNPDWSNVTKHSNTTVGTTIQWKIYANDTNDNWNTSSTYSYVTTEAAADSCTYSGSGDWTIDCADNCDLVSTDLLDNNIYASGAGTVTNIRNVYNYSRLHISGGCNGKV